MTKKDLIYQLKDYLNKYPDERIKVDNILEFINRENECFERNNWNGHFTGSAWIVDDTRNWVLMTKHLQLNMWLQLGGHAEGNSNLFKVALKEAIEESGLTKFTALSSQIFDLDIHQIPRFKNLPSHLHYDVRYIFEAKIKNEKIIISDESHDVSWVNKNDVLNKNSEESISRMLNKMKEY